MSSGKKNRKKEKIGVLCGGLSKEREISLQSGAAVTEGLRQAGFNTVQIDVTDRLDEQIRKTAIDVAFIALHGRFGEDGTVQGMLEIMGIPYTGSPPLASALAMDKYRTRQLLAARGLKVAPGFLATSREDVCSRDMEFPAVIKPAEEGSSIGISIASDKDDYIKGLETAFEYSSRVLVEKYVDGMEVQVGVFDDRALGAVEVVPAFEFYDYRAKYEEGGSTHHIPPRISMEQLERACNVAISACDAIGCTGASRVDLIVENSNDITTLEINTIPGMTQKSLLPEIAASAEIPFEKLVSMMVENASLHTGG